MGRSSSAYFAGIDKAQAGWRTLARAAFLRPFRGPNGRAEESGILDRASGNVARVSSSEATGLSYPPTERIFYSRATANKPTGLGVKKMQNTQSQNMQPNQEQDLRPSDRPGGIHAGGLTVQRSPINQRVSDDWMQCLQQTREMQISIPEAQATKGKTREECRAITKALIEAQRPRLEARIKQLQAKNKAPLHPSEMP